MKQWKCTVCGYIHKGPEPPDTCPVCGADKSKFILLDEETARPPHPGATALKKIASDKTSGKFRCPVCGYIHKGSEPPDKCPVCSSDQYKFVRLDDDQAVRGDAVRAAAIEPDAGDGDRKWGCAVCRYIHKGSAPPDKCPVCGSDKSKFAPIEPEPSVAPGPSSSRKQTPQPATAQESDTRSQGINASIRRAIGANQALANGLTRLHAHPIAVHIPNGVLPVTVIFTLLALLFKWEALAIAARVNMIFVCLSMPVVILTGFVDWHNRFEGRMSRVFAIKMICAGVVFFLSLISVLWGLFQAGVYLAHSSMAWLFILINMAALAAAAVAGWYGGKLVFPNND